MTRIMNEIERQEERERTRMRHPRHPEKGTKRCLSVLLVVRRDVPRFWGKQTFTISCVIPRWQSHSHTVIARQRLSLRLRDLDSHLII